MIIDFIKEKNHVMTWSRQTKVTDLMYEGKYSVKDEFLWELALGADQAWIKVNMMEMTDLYQVDIAVFGGYGSVELQLSLDNVNWYTVERNKDGKWSGYDNISFIYLRMFFTDVQPGFKMTNWQIFGDERIKLGKELISLVAQRYYPQSFFENYPLLPDFVKKYLMMLERHETSIKKFFDDVITVEVYLIFREGDEGTGAIDGFPINSTPINGNSSTVFVGPNAVVINRVRGDYAWYDLDGNIIVGDVIGMPLDFRSVVYGIDVGNNNQNESNAIYTWDFDDPWADPINNPNTFSVLEWGEQTHSFTKLGLYDVRFVVQKNKRAYEGTQHVEIAPSPYTIKGPLYPQDGDKYIINGLLRPYDPPIITGGGTLIDNNDRTFTFFSNGADGVGDSGAGEIRIWDAYYEEWVAITIYYNDPILDLDGNPVLDSTGNTVYAY